MIIIVVYCRCGQFQAALGPLLVVWWAIWAALLAKYGKENTSRYRTIMIIIVIVNMDYCNSIRVGITVPRVNC